MDTAYDAEYPATVRLKHNCSGTLVAPHWVLTSRHCVDGIGFFDKGVHAGPFPDEDDDMAPLNYGFDQREFVHTFASSRQILTIPDDPLVNERATDLALMRVDEPIRPPFAIPARVPTPGQCSPAGELAGRAVGFSTLGWAIDHPDEYGCPRQQPSRRRFGPTFRTWEDPLYAFKEPLGTVWDEYLTYEHYFHSTTEGDPCEEMVGTPTPGDSGGSLYRRSFAEDREPLVCGVIQGYSSHSETDIQAVTAGVDTHYVAAWINFHIIDNDENLEGTCEPVRDDNSNDRDGDGFSDTCDNCPDLDNEHQLDSEPDGIGDACQHCVSVNPYDASGLAEAPNRNLEVELALFDPELTAVPTLRRDGFADGATGQAQFDAAVAAQLAAFHPDACDPMPVPTQQLVDDGDLPGAVLPTFDPSDPACVTQGGSALTIRNRIEVEVKRSDFVDAGGAVATVGLRWCDCHEVGSPTGDIVGRKACRTLGSTPCEYVPTDYRNSSSPWVEIVTKNETTGWSSPPFTRTGVEWDVPVGGTLTAYWDFTKLPAGVITSSPTRESVNGILWAHIDGLDRAVQGIDVTELPRRGNTLGSGDAFWEYGPKEGSRPYMTVNEWYRCAGCPFTLLQRYVERGRPQDWFETILDGSSRINPPDEIAQEFYEDVAEGVIRHIPASEPLAILAKAFPAGTTWTRALGIDAEGEIVPITASSFDGFSGPLKRPTAALSAASVEPSEASAMGEGSALAFSAIKQRLYVIGGREPDGQFRGKGTFHDLGTGAWRDFELPAEDPVEDVISATYRYEDEAVYFLDARDGHVRLRRWNAQRRTLDGLVQTIAILPKAWNVFGSHDVVAGMSGELAVVGWNGPANRKSWVLRMRVERHRQVVAVSLLAPLEPLLSPPALGEDGLAYTVMPRSGGRPAGRFAAFTDFGPVPPGKAPELLAH